MKARVVGKAERPLTQSEIQRLNLFCESLGMSKESMRDAVIEECYQQLKEQQEDMVKRIQNMMLLAMAYAGLSSRTAERVLRIFDESVMPMHKSYLEPDMIAGTTCCDAGIQMHLESHGFPHLATEKEM